MDAEYLDPAVFGDRIGAESFDAAMSRLSHHFAAKDAEIAKLRAEADALRSDRDDVIRRNAQLAGDTAPLDQAIAHLANYCHARGYADECAAMQQPGSRSKFAETLRWVLGNAHADRKFLLSELDAARAALDGEREACDEAMQLIHREARRLARKGKR